MKENKYNDPTFFKKYSKMDRSKNGLESAGEWHELKKMLPDFKDKRVLDLGCGFGWHCQYAVDNGSKLVVGVDISEKMIDVARKKTNTDMIKYICTPLEDVDLSNDSFDLVISSLTLHYIKSFEEILEKINDMLVPGGDLVFSVEHPIFTSRESQDWYYDEKGNPLHWPVDGYFNEGLRNSTFLGEKVVKYHRTLTSYLNTLIKLGYEVTGVVEPTPSKELLDTIPEMVEELRRPMMLIISARKR